MTTNLLICFSIFLKYSNGNVIYKVGGENPCFHGWVGKNRHFFFSWTIKSLFPQYILNSLIHNTIRNNSIPFPLGCPGSPWIKKYPFLLQPMNFFLLIHLSMRLHMQVSNLQQLYSRRVPNTLDEIYSLNFTTAPFVFLLTVATPNFPIQQIFIAILSTSN